MPSITINCDRIVHKAGEDHVIKVEGRLKLTLNGDIVHTKAEEKTS